VTTPIHRLTHPPHHQRYLSAIEREEHHGAWRLDDGREVLCLAGRVCVWFPSPADGVEAVEVEWPAGVSAKEVVRRLDAGNVK
jgi:hypothetical protein